MAFRQIGTQNTAVANAICNVFGATVGTAPVLVLPVGTRGSIFWHNPGLSGAPSVWIYPAINPTTGGFQILSPGAGGTFRLDPDIGLEITPPGNGAWWAVSNAAGGSITAAVF